jgi:hypothetical protein
VFLAESVQSKIMPRFGFHLNKVFTRKRLIYAAPLLAIPIFLFAEPRTNCRIGKLSPRGEGGDKDKIEMGEKAAAASKELKE